MEYLFILIICSLSSKDEIVLDFENLGDGGRIERIISKINLNLKNNNIGDLDYNGTGGGFLFDAKSWASPNVSINSFSFSKINSSGNGAGLYISDAFDVCIINTSFFKCDSAKNGGAMFLNNNAGYTIIYNCSFENCSAQIGSSIYYESVTNDVRIEKSVFSKGTKTNVYLSGNLYKNCTINDCVFLKFSSLCNDLIYVSNFISLLLSNDLFYDCSLNGRYLYMVGANTSNAIKSCCFFNCNTNSGGNIIYCVTSFSANFSMELFSISNSFVFQNLVRMINFIVVHENNNISRCIGTTGIAVEGFRTFSTLFSSYSNISLNRYLFMCGNDFNFSQFSYNNVVSNAAQATVYSINSILSNLIFKNCIFINNNGCLIQALRSNVTIIDCYIVHNFYSYTLWNTNSVSTLFTKNIIAVIPTHTYSLDLLSTAFCAVHNEDNATELLPCQTMNPLCSNNQANEAVFSIPIFIGTFLILQ